MNPIPGQANTRIVTLLDSDGAAVTDAGGVTAQYYLKATTGANAGKWWKASDNAWSATEVSAGAMTHGQRGQWSVSIASGAWVDQVEYQEYAVDSGGVAIVVARQLRCETTKAGMKLAADGLDLIADRCPTAAQNADALLDRNHGIETNITLRQAIRIVAAVLAGKVAGAGSGDERFFGLDGATLRVEVATDPLGNRTAVSYTPS
jgi:hypothetical protein